MKRLIFLFGLCAGLVSAGAEEQPSAREILEGVRFQQSLQQFDLQGQLREESLVVPFRLTQEGPVVKYSFVNPPGALLLRLGETESRLEELSYEGADRISGAGFDRAVRGTSLSYEDLALKFLYWREARVVGEETVRTRRCWKLELRPPDAHSQYARVWLWVGQAGGELMRMEGHDEAGRLLKRFEVISAQKIDGRWFLKQMRVEKFEPGTGKVAARAYLEIKK